MKPEIRFVATPTGQADALRAAAPWLDRFQATPPPGFTVFETPSRSAAAGVYYEIRLAGPALPYAPELRALLAALPCRVSERDAVRLDAAQEDACSLKQLVGPYEGATLEAPPLIARQRCSGCRDTLDVRTEIAEVRLTQAPPLPAAFAVAEPPNPNPEAFGPVTLAAAAVVRGLQAAGLTDGLDVLPVHVDGAPREDLVALVAARSLGPPLAPYGTSFACPVCLRDRANYRLLPCWERPSGGGHWWGHPATGSSTLLVDRAVWDWLHGPGRALAFAPGLEDRIRFFPAVWYDEQPEICFLPPELRGERPPSAELLALLGG